MPGQPPCWQGQSGVVMARPAGRAHVAPVAAADTAVPPRSLEDLVTVRAQHWVDLHLDVPLVLLVPALRVLHHRSIVHTFDDRQAEDRPTATRAGHSDLQVFSVVLIRNGT